MDFTETAQNILLSTRGKNATRWLWPEIMLIRLMYTLLYNATGKCMTPCNLYITANATVQFAVLPKKALVKEPQ